MHEFNISDLTTKLIREKSYIANFDIKANRGILKDGTKFSIEKKCFESLTIREIMSFLSEFEEVKEIVSLKDAIIQSIQTFIKEESRRIDEVLAKIIETDESRLSIEFISENINDVGIKILAEKFFSNASTTYTDEITKLFNQNFYKEYLEPKDSAKQEQLLEIIKGAHIWDGYEDEIGIVYMDLDNLKAINDLINHAAGDRAIEAFGHKLLKDINLPSIPVRVGGDEFALLCKKEDATEIAKKIESLSFTEALNEEISSHIRPSESVVLEEYPFKATCSSSSFCIGASVDIKKTFSEAFLKCDKAVRDKKEEREAKHKFRDVKNR